MKSGILNPEIQPLRVRRSELLTQLKEQEADHKKKEKTAQAASHVSMKSYYKVKEIESAIEKIDQAIEALSSVEKDGWLGD